MTSIADTICWVQMGKASTEEPWSMDDHRSIHKVGMAYWKLRSLSRVFGGYDEARMRTLDEKLTCKFLRRCLTSWLIACFLKQEYQLLSQGLQLVKS